MNKKTFIFKMIVSASLLSTLGVLTNCDSRTAGSTGNDNAKNKFANSSPLPNKSLIETANEIETVPTDPSKIPTVNYCDLVKNAADYDRKIVRLRAIYFTGFEKTYIYDSRCEKGSAPEAPENVPAETWAEQDQSLVTKGDSIEAKTNRQLNGFGRREVFIIGRFYSTNEQNDRDAPNLFGHLNCCRFLFRIMRVESIGNLDGEKAKVVNDYGKRIKFAPAQKLAFADFTLEFSGETQILVAVPQPDRKLPKYYFRISCGNASIIVWGNDEGDDTPLKFDFGGASYQLETGIYNKSGNLAKDELIVRKAN